MSRREFHFTEGTSKKFWAIELQGDEHTVQFGRLGTTGQTQTKCFATEAEARKSCDKLIAEKVKKGYVEVGAAAGTKGPGVATPKPATRKGKKAAAPEPAPAAPEPAVPPSPPPAFAERSIVLSPEDNAWSPGRYPWQRKRRPEPRAFDLDACVAKLSGIKTNQYDFWMPWIWPQEVMPEALTPPEAEFWLEAMLRSQNRVKPQKIAEELAKEKLTGRLTPEEAMRKVSEKTYQAHPELALVLAHLFPLRQLVDFIRDPGLVGERIAKGFRQYVLPYLSDEEIEEVRRQIRGDVTPDRWQPNWSDSAPGVYWLAIYLNMHPELRALVASWVPQPYYWSPREFLYCLGAPKVVEAEARRLKMPLPKPEDVRIWLAITQYTALDYVRDAILRLTNKAEAEKLLHEFARVKAPEAAPLMLELRLSSRAPQVARQWLEDNPGHAITGLVSVAAGRGKLAEAAVEYLRDAKRKGYEAVIAERLAQEPAETAAKVRRDVLEYEEKVYEPLDAAGTPDGLRSALEDALPLQGAKLPPWLNAALPPLLVGGRRLNDEQIRLLLGALQKSNFDAPHPLLAALKQHASRESLDAFVWKLFELWLEAGAPTKEKWAMAALGLLGGDAVALKLTPLVRAWPGESQHPRAVLGLECLRAIGSDTALMQLNGIAQKLKFKGLQSKAREFMEAIAQDRGMSRTELEDRIVPDCDLDERGRRVFDFGPRRFRFVLGPDMKPMVKDEEDKARADLPAPGARDDAEKAAAAAADWKLLKKQVKEVANLQAGRLEQAMVTGRRWTVPQFETLLVRHPLMTNLARLLLWGGYDAGGKLVAPFRVTDEQDYADAQDEPFRLDGVEQAGIVHPLQLTEEQRASWGEVFADYAIIPPFPQLGRPVHTLQPGEAKEVELERFKGLKIEAITLVGTLERLGWQRGALGDHGDFYEHIKYFPSTDVTALVLYETGVLTGMINQSEDQTITLCCFLRGPYRPQSFPRHKPDLPLGRVDPVVVSEVLSDLTALAAKGK